MKKMIYMLLIILLMVFVMTSCKPVGASNEGNVAHRGDVSNVICTYEPPEGLNVDTEDKDYYLFEDGNRAAYFNYWVDSESYDYDIFDSFSKDLFREIEKETLKKIFEKDVELEITNFEFLEIDGLPAYRVDEVYKVDDIEGIAVTIIVGADKIYNFTYEEECTDEFTEAIEKSIASIHFKYDE